MGPRERLEATLRERPEDAEAWLAYASHLAEDGDPRGELIRLEARMVQLGLGSPERDEVWERWRTMKSEVERRLLDHWEPRVAASFDWRSGFVLAVTFADPHPLEDLESLLEKPVVRFLSRARFEHLAVEELPALERMMSRSPLRHLVFANRRSVFAPPDTPQGGFGDAGVEALARASCLGSLSTLTVDEQSLSCAGLRALFGSTVLAGLDELAVSGHEPGFADFTAEGVVWALASLRSLRIGECRLDDLTLVELVSVLPRTLERLDLQGNLIAHPAAVLETLHETLPGLREVSFASNRIGDRGAIEIAEVLPRLRLASLDLAYNRMSEDGYQILLETESAVEVSLMAQRG